MAFVIAILNLLRYNKAEWYFIKWDNYGKWVQCVAPWKGKIKLMDSFEDAWKVISDYCKSKITDIAYNTWISRIQPVDLDFDNGTAYLLVPNDFHAQTLRRCYMSLLNEGFEEIFGTKFNIEFRTPANAPKNQSRLRRHQSQHRRQPLLFCKAPTAVLTNTPLTHLLSARQISLLMQPVLQLQQIRHMPTTPSFFTETRDSARLTFCMQSAMKSRKTIRQRLSVT